MFNFPKRNKSEPQSQFDGDSLVSSASVPAANATQQELIRVAFKDTLRASGVPTKWLGCEVHLVTDRHNVPRMQVHLVMNKWSGQMLRYSQAFQHQMLACLDRYEPGVDHRAYEWLWRYSDTCNVPFPHMPAPEEWAKKRETTKENAPVDMFERRKVTRS
jgi:hypothetical protein